MLHIIGIDLRGVQSLSIKAFTILKSCQKIYTDVYTSIIQNSEGQFVDIASELTSLLTNNAECISLKHETNKSISEIVQSAKNGYDTAFIVLYDPFSFSKFTGDLILHTEKENVQYTITHNTSMQTSIGRCGLTLVSFDYVTIPFYNDNTMATNFVEDIKLNLQSGLHSFCRLGIQLKNETNDNSSFNLMTCAIAARMLIDGYDNVGGLSDDTFCIGMSRLGCETERICVGTLSQMTLSDTFLGGSLHCLVIVGKCHDLELLFLNQFPTIESLTTTRDDNIHTNNECLYLIGLGLGGVEDLSLESFAFLKTCQRIYLETYTSVVLNAEGQFTDIVADLKELLVNGAEYVTADREMVECGTEIVSAAKSGLRTAFLVVGDPLSSATHTDLILRALEEGVTYKIMNNTSIMTAVSCSGLQLSKFCQTVSIPYWDDCGKQISILDKIEANLQRERHTLCLLDIKVKERSIENIVRDRKIYEPPRFMTCSTAATQLLECLDSDGFRLSKDTLCVGMARVGCTTQRIFCGSLEQVAESSGEKLGGPLHCLLIAGQCDDEELVFLSHAAAIDLITVKDLYRKHLASFHI